MSNDMAWGRCRQPHEEVLVRKRDDGDGEYKIDDDDDGLKKGKKRPRKAKAASPPREGSRKSRRLANQPALGEEGIDVANDDDNDWRNDKTLTTKERRAALVAECREARQRAANEVAKAGFQLAAKENPTASYEHCLMRVRSMSEKALAARVRKKEQHLIVPGANIRYLPIVQSPHISYAHTLHILVELGLFALAFITRFVKSKVQPVNIAW